MEEERQLRGKRRKKKRFRKRGILLLLLIVLLAAGVYSFFQFQSGKNLAEETDLPAMNFSGDDDNGNYENILVLGVDSRGEAQSRTDTMMLVAHNKETNDVKVVSFMRDIYAQIPGYQSYKLNTAFYLGEADLLADTLRSMFGVEIHHYAMLDFTSFEKLVDIGAPDGVEIDVEKDMSEKIGVTLTQGRQKLDGQELLGYARFRADSEGDFGRVSRQQQVMAALKEEMISLSAIPKFPKLAGAAQGYVQTDMPVLDQMKLAVDMAIGGSSDIERLTIPVDNSYRNASYSHAGSVLEIDLDQNRQALGEFLGQSLQ
ncbi:LCP family protein [Planococcus beigongshangi]|uniref:LCP family protein n=1 Tax=Planococcus beigongshangi TaxID=2782536 RepID=UPI00193B6738|nr:LCP family protein [Planococcus beigongshangi]